MALIRAHFYQNAIKVSRWTVISDATGKHFNVTLPSLGLHCLNRNGQVSIAELQNLLTQARIFSYHIPDTKLNKTFMEYDKLTSDRMTFMASTQTVLAQNLLQSTEVPSFAVRLSLGHIGRTSLNTRAELIDTTTNTVLAKNINQVVTVSRETRRPIALPEWWVNKYSSYSIVIPKLVVPVPETPADVFTYDVHVRWSDTDGYGHTNYISYIRFCEDGVMQAENEGKLSGFTKNFQEFESKMLQLSYLGESKAGDELTVSLWQDQQNDYKLYFNLYKTDNMSLVFHCTLELYEKSH